ncbi:MAG: flagellar biosis protein [Planctomycetota bacterium]|nr:flagellar biosis protein [Planctomycetota bacterium]
MTRTILRGWAVASVGVLTLALSPASSADAAKAASLAHHPISRPDSSARPGAHPSPTSGGFWIGTGGIAVALAAFGAIGLGAKKLRPGAEAGPLKVIGRTVLSPRHSVYLLRAGDRILIVGAGSQGPPSLLGELTEAEVSTPTAPHPHRAHVGRIGAPS